MRPIVSCVDQLSVSRQERTIFVPPGDSGLCSLGLVQLNNIASDHIFAHNNITHLSYWKPCIKVANE